ncbi:MAG: hypothetical protein ACLR7Z_00035 [Bilophila wadsworthia]
MRRGAGYGGHRLGNIRQTLGLFGSFLLLPKGFAAFFESLSSAVMHSTASLRPMLRLF